MDNDVYLRWTENVAEAEAYHEQILNGFELWLQEKAIDSDTVKINISNIGFFANQYLLRTQINILHESLNEVIPFLSGYFLDKCLWANNKSMNLYFDSFLELYAYLEEINKITEEAKGLLSSEIQLNKELLLRKF